MKNGKWSEFELRLQRLEEEVRQLRSTIEATQQPLGWKAFAGSHAGDPVFHEIVELGRKLREAERPKPSRKKAKTPQ